MTKQVRLAIPDNTKLVYRLKNGDTITIDIDKDKMESFYASVSVNESLERILKQSPHLEHWEH